MPSSSRSYATLAVLVVLLIGGIFAAMSDLKARSAAREAHGKIKEWVLADQPKTPEEVRELLGTSPDNPPNQEADIATEIYRWEGIFRDYTVTVTYQGKTPRLVAAALNDDG